METLLKDFLKLCTCVIRDVAVGINDIPFFRVDLTGGADADGIKWEGLLCESADGFEDVRACLLYTSFRNAMKPVLVILVFRIPMLVGGSVVIESVFSYPGIGLTMTNAIVSGDSPVVLVTTLIIAAAMLICSFMVDALNALLDPRVRLSLIHI